MTTWYTSDLHLGHANIVTFCDRPWDTVEQMNEGIVQRWNDVVAPDDEVYVLGDLALGKLDDSLAVAARLNGIKYLVPGNHDRCWSGYRRDGKVRPEDVKRYEEAGFMVLAERVITDLDRGHSPEVLLCHFPYMLDERHGTRYAEHHPEDQGMWLLHGHTHSTKILSDHPRQIHVGMDAWGYTPVDEEWILELIHEDHGVYT